LRDFTHHFFECAHTFFRALTYYLAPVLRAVADRTVAFGNVSICRLPLRWDGIENVCSPRSVRT
jgi:hypothetical protein